MRIINLLQQHSHCVDSWYVLWLLYCPQWQRQCGRKIAEEIELIINCVFHKLLKSWVEKWILKLRTDYRVHYGQYLERSCPCVTRKTWPSVHPVCRRLLQSGLTKGRSTKHTVWLLSEIHLLFMSLFGHVSCLDNDTFALGDLTLCYPRPHWTPSPLPMDGEGPPVKRLWYGKTEARARTETVLRHNYSRCREMRSTLLKHFVLRIKSQAIRHA